MDNVTIELSIFVGKSDKEIVEFLQENKFLKPNGICENCHVARRLIANKMYKGGCGARCPRCRKFKKLTDGTFF